MGEESPGRIPRWTSASGTNATAGLALGLAKTLVIEKEKQPIFFDRSAQANTKLVSAEWRSLSVEKMARVQRAVSQKFIDRTMKRVGAGLRCNVHHGPITAEFCAVAAGEHLQPSRRLDAK